MRLLALMAGLGCLAAAAASEPALRVRFWILPSLLSIRHVHNLM